MLGNLSLLLLSSADFFQNEVLQKNTTCIRVLNGLDRIQDQNFVRPDWVQTVCKCYQKTTKVTASKESVMAKCNVMVVRTIWA